MPLAALIAAQDQTDVGDGLRATLPLAGRTLIEYQAAIAARAGASHIVVLVERVPAALAQAIDRLRRHGTRVEVARSVADATDRFHPHEEILLIADGAIAAQASIGELVAAGAPALITLPDSQDHGDFERIDAESRWAGFAMTDGASLLATAQMLGDWDLSSTLLRRLVQQGASRIDGLTPDHAPILAMGPSAIGPLEAMMLRRAAPAEGNWVQRYLYRLVAAPLIGPMIARNIDRRHVALAAVALAWIGAVCAIFGLFWPGVLLLPAAAALAAADQRMIRLWSDEAGPGVPFAAARHVAALCVLVMIGRAIAADGGWGWWVIAAAIPASLAGLWALLPIERAVSADAPGLWIATPDALVWTAPPLALLGGWRWMVMALAFYAFLSFLRRFAAARRGATAMDEGV